MEIKINEISKEIQNILAKYNVTFEHIEIVLEQSALAIKSRTKINTID